MSNLEIQLTYLAQEIQSIITAVENAGAVIPKPCTLENLKSSILALANANAQKLERKVQILHKENKFLHESDFVGCSYIQEYEHCDNKNLVELSVPNNIQIIHPYAFKNCKRLEKVTLPVYPPTLTDKNAFEQINYFFNMFVESGSFLEYFTHQKWSHFCNNFALKDDANSHITINIFQDNQKNLTLYFNKTTADTLQINWGDGTQYTTTQTGNLTASHLYQNHGNYLITFSLPTKATFAFGHYGVSQCFVGSDNAPSLTNVFMGTNVATAFNYCFSYCNNIVNITRQTKYSTPSAFNYCGAKNIYFKTAENLCTLEIANCSCIEKIKLPEGITTLNNFCFNNCTNLKKVILPSTLVTICDSVLGQCPNLQKIYCLACQPPVLISKLISIGFNPQIFIPRGSLQAYCSATNWALYTNLFIEFDVEDYCYD